jgi:putative CocE/NonD family hydrolase
LRAWLATSAAVAIIACAGSALAAPPPEQVQLPAGAQVGDYVGQDMMIPMRDGVKLHAQVWRPKSQAGPLPILLQRSPYGFGLHAAQASFAAQFKELADDGYIFVLEDIRGKFGSEGDFVMLRPQATSPKQIDESTDTFDTIDWAVKTLPDNNGKVGQFGISYLGWTTAIATINPHPALKAVSVQASPEDMFLGDDFHHNGAFRLDYAWEYAATLETDPHALTPFKFGSEDPYDWYLRQGALDGYDRKNVDKPLPTWRNFVDHPNYDAFWKANVTSHEMPATPSVPDLFVAGWWDQEDFYGPVTIYERQAKGDRFNRDYIVIGPWNHGGWAGKEGAKYGPYDLGGATSVYFRTQVEAPWFHYWLKGGDALKEPRALVFETGSNTWRGYSAWPPKDGVVEKRLYLHAGGKLSFDPPTAADAQPDRFVSDPANPVPYRPRPITPVIAQGSTWPVWLADDQSSFDKRPDVLTFRTDVLDGDVAIRGEAIAKLFASTTGTDADWIVKLIDAWPSDEATPPELRGREEIISDEVFRGRFLESFEHPKALTPGKPLDYSIDLHSASHRFLKGHRIEVQIQSSWFPLIDRNPQVFSPSIFTADPSTFKAQTHAVFHSKAYPSAILVDVAAGKD